MCVWGHPYILATVHYRAVEKCLEFDEVQTFSILCEKNAFCFLWYTKNIITCKY